MRALKPYLKAIVAALGAGLTATAGIVAADSMAGRVVTIALAVLTAVGTYQVPNRPVVPASVQLLRDQAAARSTGKHTAP